MVCITARGDFIPVIISLRGQPAFWTEEDEWPQLRSQLLDSLVFHIGDMQDARFLFDAAPEEAPLSTDFQNMQIVVTNIEM